MKHRLLLFLCLLIFASCSLFESSDDVPMYLDIESAELSTSPNEGASTTRFQGVSVFADGFNIGLFPIPAAVPVLDENEDGESEITIFPVIRNNGIGSNPIQYPYYDAAEFNFEFQPGLHRTIDLEFRYVDNVEFVILEDFESSHIFDASIDQVPETRFERSDETPYGAFCGKVVTTPEFPVFEEATVFRYSKEDVAASPIFLEMDYRNDIPFKVGVIKYDAMIGIREYKIVLTERPEWNKIYIELTDLLGGQDYEEFQLVFGSTSSSATGSVWIDNVKLLVLK